jgi:hypothetical protein
MSFESAIGISVVVTFVVFILLFVYIYYFNFIRINGRYIYAIALCNMKIPKLIDRNKIKDLIKSNNLNSYSSFMNKNFGDINNDIKSIKSIQTIINNKYYEDINSISKHIPKDFKPIFMAYNIITENDIMKNLYKFFYHRFNDKSDDEYMIDLIVPFGFFSKSLLEKAKKVKTYSDFRNLFIGSFYYDLFTDKILTPYDFRKKIDSYTFEYVYKKASIIRIKEKDLLIQYLNSAKLLTEIKIAFSEKKFIIDNINFENDIDYLNYIINEKKYLEGMKKYFDKYKKTKNFFWIIDGHEKSSVVFVNKLTQLNVFSPIIVIKYMILKRYERRNLIVLSNFYNNTISQENALEVI